MSYRSILSEHAYSADQGDTVAAYRQAVADRNAFGLRIHAELKELGAGQHVYVTESRRRGHPDQVIALEQQDDHIPDGWRLVGGRLVPRRGKPGDAARAWLAAHRLPDVRYVMESHGLPRVSWVSTGDLSWSIATPKLFEHDGVLWACYTSEPGTSDRCTDTTPCTWTARKLSEFYAASEAFDADRAAEAVTVDA